MWVGEKGVLSVDVTVAMSVGEMGEILVGKRADRRVDWMVVVSVGRKA